MFDLDKKIDIWCRTVHTGGRHLEARIDKLTDHIYCAVERLQKEGISEEKAFVMATHLMGDTEVFMMNHTKNASWLSRIGQAEENKINTLLHKWGINLSPEKGALLQIGIALFFAGVMLFSDYVLEGTAYNATVKYTIIAVWFVPFSILAMIANRKEENSVR